MPREATCPHCGHVLRVSPNAEERWLTCPRCLTSVGNPNRVLPTEPSAEAVATAPAPEGSSCPSCNRKVDPGWRVCPHCGRTLTRERPEPVVASLDDEVRRDSRGGGAVALVLGGLLMAGVVLFVVFGGPGMAQSVADPGQVLVFGMMAIGAFLVGVVALVFGLRKKAVGPVPGIVGGVAAGAGFVLLVVLVACMTVIAAVANLMNVCQCK